MGNLSLWLKGIKGKLLGVSVFPFIAFAIIFGFTYTGLNKISRVVESAHNDIIPNISSLDDMRIYQNRFGYRMWEGLNSEEDRLESVKECKESMVGFKEAYNRYTSTSFAPEETVMFNEVKDVFGKYTELADSIVADLEKGTP